jgi:hypothetical protein
MVTKIRLCKEHIVFLLGFLHPAVTLRLPGQNTGRFIMFCVITNVYNKKTKGPPLMELFTATGKLKKFFLQLEMFDVCTTADAAHIEHI